MSKILTMKMNRNYYKQGQSSKVPYLLAIVILVLLYIMNGMNEDRKDADMMFNQVMKEFTKNDSLENKDYLKYKREKDSLITIIEWYKINYKKKDNRIIKTNTKTVTKKDTL